MININENIFDTITELHIAFKDKNKFKYQCYLAKLELDLNDYYDKMEHEHPEESNIIIYYERLWLL